MPTRGVCLLLLIMLAGCRAAPPVATVAWAPGGNVLMSSNRAVQAGADAWTTRAPWPAIHNGYRFDEVTTYTQFEVDDQYFNDRLGGGYYRTLESTKTGVWVR